MHLKTLKRSEYWDIAIMLYAPIEAPTSSEVVLDNYEIRVFAFTVSDPSETFIGSRFLARFQDSQSKQQQSLKIVLTGRTIASLDIQNASLREAIALAELGRDRAQHESRLCQRSAEEKMRKLTEEHVQLQ
eukprot:TRINITY_DN30598_c0_g2_i1.p1 TRINITY_DN30598_c0_g2~~TRINITY_DN30598_c0_g2_i1.p1  ORF type:complete len:148 (+),score=9.60 TRINITY_DN30598_c0_g2_i1:54-446(+)